MISTLSSQPIALSSDQNKANIAKPTPINPELEQGNNGLHKGQHKSSVTDEVILSQKSLSLSKTESVSEVKVISEESKLNPYAKEILAGISSHIDRLKADGAGVETLKQAVYDGLNGFQQGYNQALGELDAAGLLSDDLKNELSKTEQQVMQGLADYAAANHLDVEITELKPSVDMSQPVEPSINVSPQPQTIISSPQAKPNYSINEVRGYQQQSIVESFTRNNSPSEMQARQSAFVESYKEQQSASMEIVTQDGDRVTLNFEALKAMQISGGFRDSEAGFTQLLDASKEESSSYGFNIEGELDQGELDALISLMEDVNALASEFFEGDFDRAFQMATEIQMDKSELSSMSLDLKRSVSYEAVQSYSNIANNGHADMSHPAFKTNYLANGLQHILEKAEPFANADDLVKDLFANQWAQQSIEGLRQNDQKQAFYDQEPLQAYA